MSNHTIVAINLDCSVGFFTEDEVEEVRIKIAEALRLKVDEVEVETDLDKLDISVIPNDS